ncbi:hypothetical protein KKB40_06475, partial [Patescibacteria group bacterium]|nr:hypothetical protein [Patescibacteria group bacterium]
ENNSLDAIDLSEPATFALVGPGYPIENFGADLVWEEIDSGPEKWKVATGETGTFFVWELSQGDCGDLLKTDPGMRSIIVVSKMITMLASLPEYPDDPTESPMTLPLAQDLKDILYVNLGKSSSGSDILWSGFWVETNEGN